MRLLEKCYIFCLNNIRAFEFVNNIVTLKVKLEQLKQDTYIKLINSNLFHDYKLIQNMAL